MAAITNLSDYGELILIENRSLKLPFSTSYLCCCYNYIENRSHMYYFSQLGEMVAIYT
jgi:hypothetical protein